MKHIVIKAEISNTLTHKELNKVTKEVKTKDKEIGTTGKLKNGLSFIVSKKAFIIF